MTDKENMSCIDNLRITGLPEEQGQIGILISYFKKLSKKTALMSSNKREK